MIVKNLKKMSEVELLSYAQKSEDGFAELYQRYHQLVYFVAYKLCKNDADAQDVVQETFIEIKRSLHNLKNPQYFRLWLYRIIDSKCKKLFRKNKYSLIDIEQDQIQNAILVKDHQALPNMQAHVQSDHQLLHNMIEDLPYDQKLAVLLYYMEQMSMIEIAQFLDIPEGTVKSRLSTARNTLRKKIELYERREGVRLDFHDLSASLASVFVGYTASNYAISSTNVLLANYKSFWKMLKTSTIATKAVIASAVLVVASSVGYIGYQVTRGSANRMVHPVVNPSMSSSFPVLQFRGEEIQTSKDAYYTLKMHVCKQDIERLNEMQREETNVLYQALKKENGVYFQRLIDTGWSDIFEK